MVEQYTTFSEKFNQLVPRFKCPKTANLMIKKCKSYLGLIFF